MIQYDAVVVGGKNSAAIAALELHWSGARVTLIHRGDALHDHVKYWIKPNLENRIAAGEIKAYFRSGIARIEPRRILIRTPEGELRLDNDYVFAMTGYHPDLGFLAVHGISLGEDGRPALNMETMESARPGLYLAGVLVAGVHTNEIFIENGRFHGAKIAADVAAKLS